jgi:hypothetical protein
MTRDTSCGDNPQHAAVREAVAAFVRRYGRKRGLHMAAQAIGIGEGAARNAHEGRHIAADDERARRADLARLELLQQEILRLHREAAEIAHRGLHVVTDGPGVDARRRVLRGDGATLLRPREALT